MPKLNIEIDDTHTKFSISTPTNDLIVSEINIPKIFSVLYVKNCSPVDST